ncbi:MAG: hypothetical protein A2849_01985 [Candidatus Taylorbacteria bacterium RIFCSPHIGHO2_01_FULL_51_15]|uniref:Uncharacterized protein n=1 Tax=Candidatus Taylorbacteria bacterium RIFCSPHIGHO2_01_FULL_51_15 TaxID=1802304 RepID=A0A1G2MD07_9BACT|nr:MAG: hypothetical protein A2849_01985 [Candidatus Taylorbacteria bacterium RIFCSPHIGHO2_01_FULL_51_15]
MTTHTISKKNKELLLITLLLNIAAVGFLALLFIEVKTKNEHISTLINEIEAEAAKESTNQSVKALIEETAPLLAELRGYMVEKEGTVFFIELLEKEGESVGVSVDITSVEKVPLEGASKIEGLRVRLKGNSTWLGVVRFLGLLELLPYEARVEQAVISRAEVAGSPWRIDLSLHVLTEK